MLLIDILKAIGITVGILLLFLFISLLSALLVPIGIFGLALFMFIQYRAYVKETKTKD